MSRSQDIQVAADLPENEAKVAITETTEFTLPEVFDDQGELRLWEDECGWNGLLLEQGRYYEVNKIHTETEWLRKDPLDQDYVLQAIASHIHDPKAGGAGNFVKRCSPP